MRLKKLIKRFTWAETDRDYVTLGPSTRINPNTNKAQLSATDGLYPTDSDLYIKSWVTNPKSVKRWTGFEATVSHVYDVDAGTIVTSTGYRLSDGTNEYYWDTAQWSVASASDWNTEAEVSNNISEFPVSSKQLQVVVNLVTTNPLYTPEVVEIKVLFESDIHFYEDIIYRSLIPALRQGIRPIARHKFIRSGVGGTTISLDEAPLETPYNIVGIDSVFNASTDPDFFSDLFVSYDEGTGIITLSEAIADGEIAFINFIYEPEVSVSTSEEYIEAEKVPAIVLTAINSYDSSESAYGGGYVANKSTGTAVVVPPPLRENIDITIVGMANKTIDFSRLSDEIKSFFANNTYIVSTGLDERYRIWLVDEFVDKTTPGQKELRNGEGRFRILNVLSWNKNAYEDYIVNKLNIRIKGEQDSVVIE